MKRIITAFLALLTLCALLASCASAKTLSCTVAELKDKMTAKAAEGDMIPYSDDRLADNLLIQKDYFEEGFFCIPVDSAGVETLAFFKAKDAAAADKLKLCLETYVRDTQNYQKDYNADNYAVACEASVKLEGNYVYLIMSKNKADIQKVIDENLK